MRKDSASFWSEAEYEPITSIDDLVSFKDKAGNTAAHHLAYIGLLRRCSSIEGLLPDPLQSVTCAGLISLVTLLIFELFFSLRSYEALLACGGRKRG